MFRAPYTYLNKTPRIWQERTTQLVKKETRSKDSAGDTNMCQKHCWLMSCFDWCGGHWLLQLQYTFLKVPDESIPIQVLVSARDVYCYQNSKQYISSIHCFDTRYVSSILISSKYQDKFQPDDWSTQASFYYVHNLERFSSSPKWHPESVWSGMGCRFWSKTLNFSLFWPNLSVRKVERYDIDTLASTILVIV